MDADVCAGRRPGAQQQYRQAPAAPVTAAMPVHTRKQDRSWRPERFTRGSGSLPAAQMQLAHVQDIRGRA